ncbi:MAG: hypothetical protein OXE46_04440 [Chloroflexi bacterium]|nr:hypothetical protein [Chloroflexota bacterium]
MLPERQAAQDYFRTLLRTVVGQAFTAAGYQLENAPLQWAGGKVRFVTTFEDGHRGTIDFQTLVYSDSAWSAGAPSRFRVHLTRFHAGNLLASRSLSQLVVVDFGIKILPSADHWWTYTDTDSLGKALAEAGHLAIGYGMPWLAGELLPPADALAVQAQEQ